jgi:FkbM family methyltransferase
MLKNQLKKAIKNRTINRCLRSVSQWVYPVLPYFKNRLPLYGQFELDVSNRKLIVDSDPYDYIGEVLYRKGMEGFEKEEMSIFRPLVKKAAVCFDIGANVGIYSLVACAENPACKVYSFEPAPSVYAYLKRNVSANNFANLKIFDYALSDSNGTMTLYVPPGNDALDLPTTASTNPDFIKGCDTTTVKTITLDAFVKEHQIPKIDLIKLDTESTEHIVLKGGAETIAKFEPIILCEVLKINEQAMNDCVQKLPYVSFHITEDGLKHMKTIVGHKHGMRNYLFVPISKLDFVQQLFNISIS